MGDRLFVFVNIIGKKKKKSIVHDEPKTETTMDKKDSLGWLFNTPHWRRLTWAFGWKKVGTTSPSLTKVHYLPCNWRWQSCSGFDAVNARFKTLIAVHRYNIVAYTRSQSIISRLFLWGLWMSKQNNGFAHAHFKFLLNEVWLCDTKALQPSVGFVQNRRRQR